MKKRIKTICNVATTLLVTLITVAAMGIWGVRFVGIDTFVVLSGSMEPEYPVGALVYVKEADPQTLAVGDVITFDLPTGARGTHRIVEILEEDGQRLFRTKGDANEYEDNGALTAQDIVGKVFLSLPQVGYFVSFLQSSRGRLTMISVIAVLLLLILLPDLLLEDKKTNIQEETK